MQIPIQFFFVETLSGKYIYKVLKNSQPFFFNVLHLLNLCNRWYNLGVQFELLHYHMYDDFCKVKMYKFVFRDFIRITDLYFVFERQKFSDVQNSFFFTPSVLFSVVETTIIL